MDFEGDLLFRSTRDGGDFSLENGLFACDKGFETAVFLSLFGGNLEDAAVVKSNLEWWGNAVGDAEEAMASRFQHFIRTHPMTSGNLVAACDAAKQDLQWMVDGEFFADVSVSARILSMIEADFEVNAQCGGDAFGAHYSVNWGTKNGV